jgi:HK97 gp10 family phage protein
MIGDFNHLPETAIALHRLTAQLVKKACFDVQAAAVAKCPHVTGYLKSSIYTHTWDSSGYGQGVVGAKPGTVLLPDLGRPPNDHTAFIGVGANYGIYVEFGTSRMAAQPYLTPAADEVRPSYVESFRRMEEHLRTLGVL